MWTKKCKCMCVRKCARKCVCVYVRACVCVCVCVCSAQSFQQSQSVRYHTAPLYSNVRTAAMFAAYLPNATFPPSQHDTKTMDSHRAPTAPCNPVCVRACVRVCVCVCVRV